MVRVHYQGLGKVWRVHYTYPIGQMSEMDERDKNIETAMTIVKSFEDKAATNGGKLELEIDRYGHIRCAVTINPPIHRSFSG